MDKHYQLSAGHALAVGEVRAACIYFRVSMSGSSVGGTPTSPALHGCVHVRVVCSKERQIGDSSFDL